MEACPKCKGTLGYVYTLVVYFNQECDWNGNPTVAETGSGPPRNEGKILECVECYTRFRRSTIERDNL